MQCLWGRLLPELNNSNILHDLPRRRVRNFVERLDELCELLLWKLLRLIWAFCGHGRVCNGILFLRWCRELHCLWGRLLPEHDNSRILHDLPRW